MIAIFLFYDYNDMPKEKERVCDLSIAILFFTLLQYEQYCKKKKNTYTQKAKESILNLNKIDVSFKVL